MLFRVVGYNFSSVIYGADNFANVVRTKLINNGIGINNIIIGQQTSELTGYRELLIDVQTPPNESIERVKTLLYLTLASELNSLGIDYISGASIPTTSQVNNTDTNNGLNNVLGNFATGAGISTPLIVGAGVLLLVLYLKK